jgi:serine/threonine-protein kinase RsbW
VAQGIDPATQGAAAVAVALSAAMEAHPTATPPQTAAIAGSILAGAVERDPADAAEVADAFVRMHAALGSDAHVVASRDDLVELAVTRCPFGAAGAGGSLCHVSSGLAGQLGARVRGSATVVLDESIADGDPECHLQVRLGADASDQDGAQPHFWPPHAVANHQTVPNLDLSVSLPRESVSVPVVRRLAGQALRAFGVYDEDVDDVQLAITEACANVIDHAAETDTYEVKIELAADRCALTIVDQGSGFDAAGVPDQAEHDAEMGRGLTLMRALVDNVAFRNEPQAGAVVHMVKTLRYDTAHPLRRPAG